MAGAAAAVALVASSMMKLGIAVRGLFVAMGPAGWVITGLSLLAGALVDGKRKLMDGKCLLIRVIQIKFRLHIATVSDLFG